MYEEIIQHPNRDIVSRRLANLPLSFQFEGVEINVYWLNYLSGVQRYTAPAEKSDLATEAAMPFHRHTFHEMHLLLQGESIYQIKGYPDFVLHGGEAIFICAHEEHRGCYSSPDQHKISLSFSLSAGADSALGKKLIACFSRNNIIRASDTQELLPVLYRILEEVGNQSMGYEEVTKALIFQLVMLLARLNNQEAYEVNSVTSDVRIDRRIGEIEAFINEHMSEMIKPIDIASNIHISTKQINRILQNAFAMTTTEYIAHVKCAYAKHLLAFTDTSIPDIAAEIGYSNVFSFTKFFRRVEGMPPALFRRSRYSFSVKEQ